VGRRNNFQWTGKDFLAGHNVSAIVLELPNRDLGSHPPAGIWARICVPHGQGEFLQADRVGRPFANVTFNSGNKEAQNMFNQSQPAEDRSTGTPSPLPAITRLIAGKRPGSPNRGK
jgi:uncharacterized protein DUF4331